VVLEEAALTGPPGGMPRDLDDESLRRLARSFYLVRMTRYGALVLAALGIGALAVAAGAPRWVWVTLMVLAVVFLAAMLLTRRRYVRARRPASEPPSSPSPRG
jgi:heme A synthase